MISIWFKLIGTIGSFMLFINFNVKKEASSRCEYFQKIMWEEWKEKLDKWENNIKFLVT